MASRCVLAMATRVLVVPWYGIHVLRLDENLLEHLGLERRRVKRGLAAAQGETGVEHDAGEVLQAQIERLHPQRLAQVVLGAFLERRDALRELLLDQPLHVRAPERGRARAAAEDEIEEGQHQGSVLSLLFNHHQSHVSDGKMAVTNVSLGEGREFRTSEPCMTRISARSSFFSTRATISSRSRSLLH